MINDKIEEYKKDAIRWELEAEKRALTECERVAWMEAKKAWLDKENEYRSMLRQKSRIRWDVEGDENSKFFHSYIKRRNNKGNIRGMMVNGLWCEDPSAFKEEMVRHYKLLFSEGSSVRPLFCCDRVEKISVEDATSLEKEFSEAEIVDAIRITDPIGLGDFRPISLIGCYYKIITKILAERVKKVVGNVVGKVQNAFIKAYDSLNWRFLSDIMKKMRFGDKWCKWVDSCLTSSTMSILVNGSPTDEFCLERGVRQGDPLSPFLFILAAEGLNAIVSEAVDKGVFKGVKIGRNNVVVSHLQYADDTIFFGEWNKENAKVLMCILKCFEEVSSLRVNYNKSKLYGVGVSEAQLRDMARWMKCGVGDFPFTYLGLPIGDNKRRVGAWNLVVEKFKNRLGEWKAKTMSFGGLLTLVKSVLGSLALYYFSMFRVPLSVINQLEEDDIWG
ncbi:reverse transcriptase domain, reverse transcriptase zinc-binding domain protein [Tanacetum coccineum]